MEVVLVLELGLVLCAFGRSTYVVPTLTSCLMSEIAGGMIQGTVCCASVRVTPIPERGTLKRSPCGRISIHDGWF